MFSQWFISSSFSACIQAGHTVATVVVSQQLVFHVSHTAGPALTHPRKQCLGSANVWIWSDFGLEGRVCCRWLRKKERLLLFGCLLQAFMANDVNSHIYIVRAIKQNFYAILNKKKKYIYIYCLFYENKLWGAGNHWFEKKIWFSANS